MKNRIRINPRREIRRLVKIVPQLTGWLFGACVLSAHAATFVSSQDGLWGAPATWWPTPGIPGPDDTVYVNHIVEAEQSYACAYLHLNNTLRIYPGYSLTVGGGIWGEEGYPRVIGSWGTFINNGTFGTSANYPAFTIDKWVTWQNAGAFNHSAGVLTLDGVWRNQPGASYNVSVDGDFLVGSGTVENYGAFAKTGADGVARVTTTFCNYGGMINVQRGGLVFGGGGVSSNGVVNVAAGADLDMCGSNTLQVYGTVTGYCPGRIGWSGGKLLLNDPVVFDFPNMYWAGGSFQGYIKNTGLMILEADTQKECYVGTLDNYGTIRQTNTGPLYLNKYVNVCRVLNQPGAVYEIQSDGTNITGSSINDLDDAFYNYGTLRKTGGNGLSRIAATFCNYGGTVEVQAGTLVLAGGGISSNGVFNASVGAVLELVGGNNPQFYGTFSGSGQGWVGWSSGRIVPNTSVVFDFANGIHWAGGSFQGYIKNTGLMILEADTQKECYVGTLDNYGTIRQTNTGPLYLNKYVNVCRVLNQPGAVYEIQSDGTNITGSSINDLDDAFYNYGTLRKTGGNGLSRIAATFCNYGGTVEVQAGTLVLAGGGISSNGVFNASVGAVLELVGGNNPQFYGTFSGSGQGWVGWSSGRIVPNTSVVFDFANGIHWAGGSFQGYIKNTGLMILEADTQKECYVGTLDNYGTIRQTNSGPLYLNKYAFVSRVLNQPGAVYEIQSDGTNITGSSINDLNDAAYNYGTLRKTGGNGLSRIAATFCNYGGTVEALTGTLEFTHYNHSNGVIRLNGGNVVLPVCTLYGGLLSGTGTVAVAGTLTSAATTAPGLSTGTLNIQGNFAQTATGTLAIELGGRDPGQFDLLAVTGNATLNGTLCVTVSPLFMPSKGDQFRILTCGNLAGAFSVTNMPPGLSLSYNSTSVVLAVTGPLPVTLLNPAVAGTNFTFSFMSQTNQTYTVEYKDDLNTTNWYFLESVAGTGALLECVIPMTNSAQRFFRVRQS